LVHHLQNASGLVFLALDLLKGNFEAVNEVILVLKLKRAKEMHRPQRGCEVR
jgi:hypothetical protein